MTKRVITLAVAMALFGAALGGCTAEEKAKPAQKCVTAFIPDETKTIVGHDPDGKPLNLFSAELTIQVEGNPTNLVDPWGRSVGWPTSGVEKKLSLMMPKGNYRVQGTWPAGSCDDTFEVASPL